MRLQRAQILVEEVIEREDSEADGQCTDLFRQHEAQEGGALIWGHRKANHSQDVHETSRERNTTRSG